MGVETSIPIDTLADDIVYNEIWRRLLTTTSTLPHKTNSKLVSFENPRYVRMLLS